MLDPKNVLAIHEKYFVCWTSMSSKLNIDDILFIDLCCQMAIWHNVTQHIMLPLAPYIKWWVQGDRFGQHILHKHYNLRIARYNTIFWNLNLKFECFLSHHAVAFTQSIVARCWVDNEDVVGAASTGDAPTVSEWSTILLPTKVQLILEVWQQSFFLLEGNYFL